MGFFAALVPIVLSISSLATVAMVVGTVATVAGLLTGSKLLSQIGMALSITGALTSMASAAGLFSSAPTGEWSLAESAQPGTMSGQIFPGAGATSAMPEVSALTTGANLPGGGIITSQQPLSAEPLATPTAQVSDTSGLVNAPGTTLPSAMPTAPLAGTAPTAPTATTATGAWGDLTTAQKWDIAAKLTSGALQIGGGMMSGMFSAMSESEKLELEQLKNQQVQANRGDTPGVIQFQPKPAPAPVGA